MGNNLSAQPDGLSLADWRVLSTCLWGAGGAECGYRPLYTPCPAPGAGAQGDGYGPEDLSTAMLTLPAGETGTDGVLRASWRYLNAYGNVPQRDDVRFDLAIKDTAVPSDGRIPSASDYPSAEEAIRCNQRIGGRQFCAFGFHDSHPKRIILGTFEVHRTRPPSTKPREYRIDIPASCNRRYLVRLLPKRVCFDQTNIAYSDDNYVGYVDFLCD